ncbi:MAG: EAL domain-containing protein [Actinomycetota bacterium]
MHSLTLAEIEAALHRDAFELWFQPIVCLRTLEVRSFEGLARLRTAPGEVIGPGHFIPRIEDEPCLSRRFTHRMIEKALGFVARCHDAGDPVGVTVNVTAASLGDPTFGARLDQQLRASGVEARQLTLEITERNFIDSTSVPSANLAELSRLGVGLAIDDFGTGWSSLDTLRWLPLTQLKVDRCFLDQADRLTTDRIIVEKVIDLAHSLHLKVVAEGIERAEQLEMLQAIGCDRGQGFLFSPAVEPELAIDLVREGVSKTPFGGLDADPTTIDGATETLFRLPADVDCISEIIDHESPSGSLFLQTLDVVPMPVFVKARDGRIVWSSESHWRRVGASSRTDVLDHRDLDLHRIDEALHYRYDDLAVLTRGEAVIDRRESQTRPDGTSFVIRTSKFPVRNRSGHVVGLVGFYVEEGDEGRLAIDRDIDRLAGLPFARGGGADPE